MLVVGLTLNSFARETYQMAMGPEPDAYLVANMFSNGGHYLSVGAYPSKSRVAGAWGDVIVEHALASPDSFNTPHRLSRT